LRVKKADGNYVFIMSKLGFAAINTRIEEINHCLYKEEPAEPVAEKKPARAAAKETPGREDTDSALRSLVERISGAEAGEEEVYEFGEEDREKIREEVSRVPTGELGHLEERFENIVSDANRRIGRLKAHRGYGRRRFIQQLQVSKSHIGALKYVHEWYYESRDSKDYDLEKYYLVGNRYFPYGTGRWYEAFRMDEDGVPIEQYTSMDDIDDPDIKKALNSRSAGFTYVDPATGDIYARYFDYIVVDEDRNVAAAFRIKRGKKDKNSRVPVHIEAYPKDLTEKEKAFCMRFWNYELGDPNTLECIPISEREFRDLASKHKELEEFAMNADQQFSAMVVREVATCESNLEHEKAKPGYGRHGSLHPNYARAHEVSPILVSTNYERFWLERDPKTGAIRKWTTGRTPFYHLTGTRRLLTPDENGPFIFTDPFLDAMGVDPDDFRLKNKYPKVLRFSPTEYTVVSGMEMMTPLSSIFGSYLLFSGAENMEELTRIGGTIEPMPPGQIRNLVNLYMAEKKADFFYLGMESSDMSPRPEYDTPLCVNF